MFAWSVLDELRRRKREWLWRASPGSANTQTRGGYVEAMNDAIAIVEKHYPGE